MGAGGNQGFINKSGETGDFEDNSGNMNEVGGTDHLKTSGMQMQSGTGGFGGGHHGSTHHHGGGSSNIKGRAGTGSDVKHSERTGATMIGVGSEEASGSSGNMKNVGVGDGGQQGEHHSQGGLHHNEHHGGHSGKHEAHHKGEHKLHGEQSGQSFGGHSNLTGTSNVGGGSDLGGGSNLGNSSGNQNIPSIQNKGNLGGVVRSDDMGGADRGQSFSKDQNNQVTKDLPSNLSSNQQ